ncbi:MAG: serine protease [Proteobacteria bacterium]|nr:serine protease [Pseudomonadota bacterium]
MSTQLFCITSLITLALACVEPLDADTVPQDDTNVTTQPIINGVSAGAMAKSVQGVMLRQSGSSLGGYCGSVYLGTNAQGQAWAATAAHCVDALQSSHRFGFGGLNISAYNTSNTVGWTQIVSHPGWDSSALVNDIAVVRLDAAPQNASPIALANNGTDASAGETVMISGYGFDTQPAWWCYLFGIGCPPTPDELLEADTTVLSTAECRQTFNGVLDTHICVEDTPGGQGACNGDSGGPMFRTNGTVIGLTSYGVGGCSPQNPSVYTRISAFRQWIADTTGI